jgi:hypothetical protein
MVSEGILGSIPSTHGFLPVRRFGCITHLHPAGRPRCPDMGGKKVLETSTVNKRGEIVAYGVQSSRIRRIYTNNSVCIIRCAIWRVSKIDRGFSSPVVKTPGCYKTITILFDLDLFVCHMSCQIRTGLLELDVALSNIL